MNKKVYDLQFATALNSTGLYIYFFFEKHLYICSSLMNSIGSKIRSHLTFIRQLMYKFNTSIKKKYANFFKWLEYIRISSFSSFSSCKLQHIALRIFWVIRGRKICFSISLNEQIVQINREHRRSYFQRHHLGDCFHPVECFSEPASASA